MSTPCRPDLHFNSYEELLTDVDQLLAEGWEKCGQWPLAMVCDHLAKWMNAMLDGGMPHIPRPLQWIARAIIRRMAQKHKYPSIVVHAPAAMKPSPDISESSAVADFRAAVARLRRLTGPAVCTYPFGPLSARDFQQMTLLHAAHHLAFLRLRRSDVQG